MNIQDIADFIDLVKNPEKYERILKNLVDERARLDAVIATVGKASELDKLRKELDKDREAFKQKIAASDAARQEEAAAEIATIVAKKESAAKLHDQATALLQEAEAKILQAETISQSFASREKELRKKEDALVEEKNKLGVLVLEYNEKLNKLRSVMA